MKNFVIAMIAFATMTGFSFGGDCAHGFCSRPSTRVLSSTKSVVKEVVTLPSKVVASCVNGKCNSRRSPRVR